MSCEEESNQPAYCMVRNYFITAFRNLTNHKLYALINISGLMVSMAVCLLIMLFVRDELSYNSFFQNSDRIYRAWVKEDYGPDEQFFNTVTPTPLAPALEANFPEVEKAVRMGIFNDIVKKEEITQTENLTYVDPAFLALFDVKIVRGVADLSGLQQLILTEDAARKYFGDTDPVGHPLSVKVGNEFLDFTVSGVAENPPANSSFQYEILLPFEVTQYLFTERRRTSWFNVGDETYVLLREGVSPEMLEKKFPAMIQQVLGERYKKDTYTIGLQPLTDIYLNADFPGGLLPISDRKYTYILSAIAIFILTVASINFVTLAMGRSVSRAKEVGVRKVVGARRTQLMYQFWSEAILVAAVAMILGIVLAQICLPFFNQMAGKTLAISFDGPTIAFLLGLALLIGTAAGSYPAAILSGFSPIAVLKGHIKVGSEREFLRKGMVAFQFTLSIILVIGTLVMQRQLQYLQNKNLGFDKEQIIVVPQNMQANRRQGFTQWLEEGRQRKQILANELAALPTVKSVALSTHTFGQNGWMEIGATMENNTYREFNMNVVDANYVETYGMEIVAGRNFVKNNTADEQQGVLVNETLVKAFGLDDPVGSSLPAPFQQYQIIGVVKDFNYRSLHSSIEPTLMVSNPAFIFENAENVDFHGDPNPRISIKIITNDMVHTLAEIKDIWKRAAPGQQFAFTFVNQALDAQYRQEQRLGKILGVTTILGIWIACLGLFGLSTLAVARRTKEIGIRKVLGASVNNIVLLIYKEFIWLLALALVIAFPVAYIAMQRWLSDFAYRITIGTDTFLLTGLLIIVVSGGTIGYQSVKAAMLDPVKSLRDE